jgi:hypothetical protein
MSDTGRLDDGTFFKGQSQDSIIPSTVKTSLMFEHQASGGESLIDFNSLNPTSLFLSQYLQPSTSSILDAKLGLLKSNVKVHSTLRGWMRPAEYTVTNVNISFNGFVAEANEIFTVTVADVLRTGGSVLVDSVPLVVENTLLEDATDFNLGQEVDVNSALIVLRGKTKLENMLQNTNNSDTVLDQDYYIVESSAGSGVGSIIRFNISGDVGGEQVSVKGMTTNLVKNDQSVLQALEVLQGKVDIIGEEVEEIAGEDLGLGTPSQPDLTAFGNRVLLLEQQAAALEALNVNDNSAVLNLDGAFTGGSIKVTRIRDQVVISAQSAITHASLSIALSSSGLLPTWARPSSAKSMISDLFVGGPLIRVDIFPTGVFSLVYFDASYSLVASTSGGSTLTTSYNV